LRKKEGDYHDRECEDACAEEWELERVPPPPQLESQLEKLKLQEDNNESDSEILDMSDAKDGGASVVTNGNYNLERWYNSTRRSL
jgi:hypothetical protein